MFKKIICAALAAAMALSLAACSYTSSTDAYKIFTEAVDTVNSAQGLDMTIKSSLSIVANGESSSMAYSASHKRQNTDGKNQSDTIIMVSAEDQSQQTEYIIDGDQGYVMYNEDASGMTKIAAADLENYMTFTKLFTGFDKGDIRKVENEKKDGKTSYDINLKEKQANEFASSYIASYMMMSADSLDAEVTRAKASLTLDENGQPASFRITLNADVWQTAEPDNKLSCILFASYLINQTGDGVEVVLPDTSQATEYTGESSSAS